MLTNFSNICYELMNVAN